MTYCSRKSWISLGLGSSSNFRSEDSESSSSMISLQRSMHSSQMYTPGPAMSFLTCFWDLPQKEHFRRSESPNFAIVLPSPGPAYRALILRASRRRGSKLGLQFPRREDLVDDPVFLGLLRGHDEVPVGVLLHLLDGLTGVLCQDLIEEQPVP